MSVGHDVLIGLSALSLTNMLFLFGGACLENFALVVLLGAQPPIGPA